MKNKTELLNGLAHFYGTEQYHRFNLLFPNVVLTDGAKYLADNAECYWLMEMIASHIRRVRGETFFTAKLEVSDGSALFILTDGNGKTYSKQGIEFTDFPLEEIELFVGQSESYYVIMLRTEY